MSFQKRDSYPAAMPPAYPFPAGQYPHGGVDYSGGTYGLSQPMSPQVMYPYVVPGMGDLRYPPGMSGEQQHMSGEPGSLADQLQGLNLRDASKDRGTNGRGYYPNGRAAAPAPGGFYFPGPQQQQQQQIPGGRGPQAQRQQGGRGSGPGAGGRGRGAGSGGPKKKRVQKGMEDNVRRTVYISYIPQQVTEEQLATFFADCGSIVDCRICGDPNSAMRFAFIEFTEAEAAEKALLLSGSMFHGSPLRVLASKTAIVPVKQEYMPRSEEEIERCSRTVYAANIDKKVDKVDVRRFFEQLCGKVNKIRLLGDYAHSTRIAFVEFAHAEGAMAALNCSGALLGTLPIRVSPSKTPVRDEKPDDARSSSAGGEREAEQLAAAASMATAAAASAAASSTDQ